jgi:hypothetical protein
MRHDDDGDDDRDDGSRACRSKTRRDDDVGDDVRDDENCAYPSTKHLDDDAGANVGVGEDQKMNRSAWADLPRGRSLAPEQHDDRRRLYVRASARESA